MNLKWKPTQISLELSRRLLGPDRAEVTKRSDNVRPDVDDTLHVVISLTPITSSRQTWRQLAPRKEVCIDLVTTKFADEARSSLHAKLEFCIRAFAVVYTAAD